MATVGLDFGTHQTKICIEDRTDKNRPRYTFFAFKDLQGNKSLMLPSIVQVNKDHTLSYGFVDEAMSEFFFPFEKQEEPQRIELEEPILSLPERPKLKKKPNKPKGNIRDWKDVLSNHFSNSNRKPTIEELWEEDCKTIDIQNALLVSSWEHECSIRKERYEKQLQDCVRQKKANEKFHDDWMQKKKERHKMVFRHFKQATFAHCDWPYDIKADMLSIWYLTFVLFELNERIGTDYATQMGIPSGYENYDQKKKKAVSLLLSAFNLITLFDNDKQKFLSVKMEDLLEKTELLPFSQEKKDEFGILIFPESVAILRSLTSNNRLENGMNLLIDIGGGTTDLSFFTINAKKVKEKEDPLSIFYYDSLPKGINYIVETATNGTVMFDRHLSLESKELDKDVLDEAKRKYTIELLNSYKKLLGEVQYSFKKTGLPVVRLNEALRDRLIVYTGGGSTFDGMCNEIETFTSVKSFNGSYLKHLFIDDFSQLDSKNLFPILAVSLGLSIEQIDDEILVAPIAELFENCVYTSDETWHQEKPDYNINR